MDRSKPSPYILAMAIHVIKLVVGVEDLEGFYSLQSNEVVDYHGQAAVPCWTRYAPKRADEILREGCSIYRVIKNRIQCRHRILGFEMVETKDKGRRCMIMQDAEMMRTVAMPHRPFQGWRYLDPAKAPRDVGLFVPGEIEEPPEDMAEELREAGLL